MQVGTAGTSGTPFYKLIVISEIKMLCYISKSGDSGDICDKSFSERISEQDLSPLFIFVSPEISPIFNDESAKNIRLQNSLTTLSPMSPEK